MDEQNRIMELAYPNFHPRQGALPLSVWIGVSVGRAL